MKQQESKNRLTNADLDAIGSLLDKQTSVLATKNEMNLKLDNLERNLKDYIHGGFDMVMGGLDDLVEKLDVRDRVEKLEQEVSKLKTTH